MFRPIILRVTIFEKIPFMGNMVLIEEICKVFCALPFLIITSNVDEDTGEFVGRLLGEPPDEVAAVCLEQGQAVRPDAAEKVGIFKSNLNRPGCPP